MNEGPPQVQPVWCNFDGTHILVNTEKGRQKYRNMSRRPSVTILAIDPDNALRWLEVRGTVAGITEEGAFEPYSFGKYPVVVTTWDQRSHIKRHRFRQVIMA